MNAPIANNVARTSALAELSERLMRAIAPTPDEPSLLPTAPRTLLTVLTEWQHQGYQIGDPYRAYPSGQIGHEEWRIPFTRPDGIEGILALFIPFEPIHTKRK